MARVDLPYGHFELDPSDESAFVSITDAGFWDPILRPFFDQTPLGTLVVDVGAHVGFYAGYMASRGYVVTAIEGAPIQAALLAHNCAANPWGPLVQVMPVMVYSRMAMLVEAPYYPQHASNPWLPVDAADFNALPLDEILDPTERVGLLKVDAQGADLHVLLGAAELIAEHRPNILIEFEPTLAALHGHTADDYHAWAAAQDYTETVINPGNAFLCPR